MFKLLAHLFLVCSIFIPTLCANGLKCHQCNSHINTTCMQLKTTTGNCVGTFLKECEGGSENLIPYCLKIDFEMLSGQEKRIIRSCGWMNSNGSLTNTCFNADNEGYVERVCHCFQEGCNSSSKFIIDYSLVLIIAAIMLASFN